MRYFIDTEFYEGFHKPLFGKKRHFIDLISIGIVSEDGRKYYAISKDFGIKAAWNAHEVLPFLTSKNHSTNDIREYWLRENVLKPIFEELHSRFVKEDDYKGSVNMKFDYDNFQYLIKKYGKSNEQIRQGIINFVCSYQEASDMAGVGSIDFGYEMFLKKYPPEFYGYYCDYDWVVLCALFGKMIDLPKGFPMYCRDLKQMLDEKVNILLYNYNNKIVENLNGDWTFEMELERFKKREDYPKQTNEHNALADAKWNLELFNFLQNL